MLGGVGEWLAWYVVGKIVIGVLAGVLVGRLLGRVAFRSRRAPLRMAEQGEPLLALAALLTSYGVAQVAEGYGFLAVFACAMALRSGERKHDYHRAMHDVVERLERLFTLLVLLMLGVGISGGVLDHLDWRGVLVGVALLFVIRPLSGLVALGVLPRRDPKAGGLSPRGRAAVAFFGVRGVGSIYYLAWATGHIDLASAPWLWSTTAFTIALSVVVHGIAATPVMKRLDEEPGQLTRRPADARPSQVWGLPSQHQPSLGARSLIHSAGTRRSCLREPASMKHLFFSSRSARCVTSAIPSSMVSGLRPRSRTVFVASSGRTLQNSSPRSTSTRRYAGAGGCASSTGWYVARSPSAWLRSTRPGRVPSRSSGTVCSGATRSRVTTSTQSAWPSRSDSGSASARVRNGSTRARNWSSVRSVRPG